MIKKLLYIISILTILTVASVLFSLHTADTSGDDALMDETPPEGMFDSETQPVYIFAHLAYKHDVKAIDAYFLEIQDHPGAGVRRDRGRFRRDELPCVCPIA